MKLRNPPAEAVINFTSKPIQSTMRLVESVGASGGKDLLATLVWGTVRQREGEVLGGELLDVWSAEVVSLLNLDNLEDLCCVSFCVRQFPVREPAGRTWMVLKRAR
jgi:hypothetical protein